MAFTPYTPSTGASGSSGSSDFKPYIPNAVPPPQPMTSTATPSAPVAGIGTAARTAGATFAQKNQANANDVEAGKITPAEGVLRTAGSLGAGLGQAVGGTFMEVAKSIAPSWLQKVAGAATDAAGKIITNPNSNSGQIISGVSNAYNQLNATHPRLAQDLMSALELGSSALVAEQAPAMVGDIAAATPKVIQSAGDTAANVAGKVLDRSAAQTAEDKILATPASKLSKLSPSEKAIWSAGQSKQIEAAHAAESAKIAADAKASSDAFAKEGERLTREANVTTPLKTTAAMKAPIRKWLSDVGNEYRSIVSKIMGSTGKTAIDPQELSAWADKNVDPETATAMKAAAGITDTAAEADVSGRSVDLSKVRGKTAADQATLDAVKSGAQKKLTVQGVYDNMQGLKGGLSRAGRTGAKVFTAADMKTNDVIHAFTDYLKDSHGLDFTPAQDFWKANKPYTAEAVRTADPFNEGIMNSEGFSKATVASVKGDPYFKEFTDKVEAGTGIKFTQDTKDAFAALSRNQQAAAADAMRAAEKQAENDLVKKAAYQKLGDAERSAALKAAKSKAAWERFSKIVTGFGVPEKLLYAAGATGAAYAGAKSLLGAGNAANQNQQ